MQDFRNLRVWQAAHQLTLTIYQVTRSFPPEERYGLTSQLRRAASAIGANIAEGCGRSSDADTRRGFHVALASACEVLNHVILARDLDFLDEPAFTAIEDQLLPIRRMLVRLIEKLGNDGRDCRRL